MSRQDRFPTRNNRLPGQYCDEKMQHLTHETVSAYYGAFMLVLLAGFAWAQQVFALHLSPAILGVLGLCGLIGFLAIFVHHKAAIRRYRQGRDGERFVGTGLEELRAHGYKIFHDVPVGHGNIDHILIGPAGLFAIETKTRDKSRHKQAVIRVSGDALLYDNGYKETRPIAQARSHARWLYLELKKKLTPPYVRAIVLIPGWWVEATETSRKEDVLVMNPGQLTAKLKAMPIILKPGQIKSFAKTLAKL